jgi:hypothetical protein
LIYSDYEKSLRGLDIPAGGAHYRAFVGPPERYDIVGAVQFNLLTYLGLRDNHYLLDIGCGSLRSGRLFITYLLPGRYYGIEPARWLIEDGIKYEIGEDIIDIKKPTFSYDDSFNLSQFKRNFDFVIAQSIFTHSPPNDIVKCLNEAKKVMLPTSIFAANFLEGSQNFKGETWVYPGCITYTSEYLNDLVREKEFNCIITPKSEVNNLRWLIVAHQGNNKLPKELETTDIRFW